MKYFFLICFLLLASCLISCQSRMICPAFQSSFIYNDNKRENLFAYFKDSLPVHEGYASKNKYGIIEDVSRRKRKEQLRIVKMERVYPEKDSVSADSLTLAMNTNQDGGGDNLDSLINAEPENLYHHNVEQANYNRLFGQYLYKPPPPEPEEADVSQDELSQEEATENMSRKERRQARKAAKEKEEEEGSQEQNADPQ